MRYARPRNCTYDGNCWNPDHGRSECPNRGCVFNTEFCKANKND